MTEGWGVMRPGDRRFHYYRDTMSLCRRVGFYRGELTADNGNPGKQDCAACRKVLDRETPVVFDSAGGSPEDARESAR